MTADLQFDHFNTIALKVFALLYGAFPNPVDLNFDDLGLLHDDELPQTELAYNTTYWLEQNGLLTVTNYYNDRPREITEALEVRLSMQGLIALQEVPSSTPSGKTLGEQMVDVASADSRDALQDKASGLVSGLLTAFRPR
ncbi:hypothetical protein [Inquilinus limosus]|uniref:Uncharacterized protein n=1 Tax=Inquilinus limosus MP06 TaxID=1398085 RepID=A0A0A0D2F3_9PROT|nr:hypothetical protein [Inquilinus limosus]KGM32871.1 hypothetical protein P409_18915 [Inquilinus limosus MP06]